MNAIERALDRLRHPGESRTMREYRRWRDTTGRGNTIEPSRVRDIGPWPAMARRVPDRRQMARPDDRRGMIVGVRMDPIMAISRERIDDDPVIRDATKAVADKVAALTKGSAEGV